VAFLPGGPTVPLICSHPDALAPPTGAGLRSGA